MKAKEFLLEAEKEDIGRYDPAADTIGIKRIGDSRPKITLAHLNRLKKIRATRKLEMLKKEDFLQIMYGAPAEEEGGGGMDF